MYAKRLGRPDGPDHTLNEIQLRLARKLVDNGCVDERDVPRRCGSSLVMELIAKDYANETGNDIYTTGRNANVPSTECWHITPGNTKVVIEKSDIKQGVVVMNIPYAEAGHFIVTIDDTENKDFYEYCQKASKLL